MIDPNLIITIVLCGTSITLYLLRVLAKKIGADAGSPQVAMDAIPTNSIIPKLLHMLRIPSSRRISQNHVLEAIEIIQKQKQDEESKNKSK